MDVLDGFIDSHYSFTGNEINDLEFSNFFFTRQLSSNEKEIKLNHLNIVYFSFKNFYKNALYFAWYKLKREPLDETYILIS